jgi:3-oxoadipate enol-lactonase
VLAHDIVGTGSVPIALLHGVGGGRIIWDDTHSGTARALASASYRVIALDLPGYGDSALTADLTLQSMADQVISSLRALDARPAVVLGHSMGGMVAQEMVARDPLAVSGLVLACTSPAFGQPGGEWQQQFLAARLAPLDQGLGMAGLAPRLVSDMVSSHSPASAVDQGVDVMRRVPEATYRAALKAIVGFDRRELLPQITVPALCLAAADDRAALPAVMQRMAQRIPGAHYRCIDRAGHLANVEAPAAFVEAVVEFLRDNRP